MNTRILLWQGAYESSFDIIRNDFIDNSNYLLIVLPSGTFSVAVPGENMMQEGLLGIGFFPNQGKGEERSVCYIKGRASQKGAKPFLQELKVPFFRMNTVVGIEPYVIFSCTSITHRGLLIWIECQNPRVAFVIWFEQWKSSGCSGRYLKETTTHICGLYQTILLILLKRPVKWKGRRFFAADLFVWDQPRKHI